LRNRGFRFGHTAPVVAAALANRISSNSSSSMVKSSGGRYQRYKARRRGRSSRRYRRKLIKRMRRKMPLFKTPKSLLPTVQYARMVYRMPVGIDGGPSATPAGSVYSYRLDVDPTRIICNSVVFPNRMGVANGTAPQSSHVAAFEYFAQRFNCYEVVASVMKATWQQVSIPASSATELLNIPYIVGVKVSDKADIFPATGASVQTYNLPNEQRCRYKPFQLNNEGNARTAVRIGWSARKQWRGARPVQNSVVRGATGFTRPIDQIFYVPFMGRCINNSSVLASHLLMLKVTYFVKWSDARTIAEWNAANPNAEMDQVNPQQAVEANEDLVHNDEDLGESLVDEGTVISEVEKIEAENLSNE